MHYTRGTARACLPSARARVIVHTSISSSESRRLRTKKKKKKEKEKEAAARSLPSASRTCRRPCPSPRVSRALSRPCLLRPVAVPGAPLALNPNHPVGGGKPGGVYLHLLSSCPPAVVCAVAVFCLRLGAVSRSLHTRCEGYRWRFCLWLSVGVQAHSIFSAHAACAFESR